MLEATPVPATDKEPRRVSSAKAESESRRKQELREERREKKVDDKSLKKGREKSPKQKTPQNRFKLDRKEALKFAKPIVEVQSERPTPINRQEIEGFLATYGKFERASLAKLSGGQLLVEVQRLLGHADIPRYSGENLEEILAQETIDRATGLDEESLSGEKVDEFITEVEDSESSAIQDREEKPKIIVSSKELTQLSRDEVLASAKEFGVKVELPEDWDELKLGQREEVLGPQAVVNEVEPAIAKREVEARTYTYWKSTDKEYSIYGFSDDLSRNEVQAILKSFGIGEKTPNNWDKRPLEERKLWLEERGIRPIIGNITSDGTTMVLDEKVFDLTRRQVRSILGKETPDEWPTMSFSSRRKWFLKEKVIFPIGGGAREMPEWNDRIPNPDFDATRPAGPDNPRDIDNPEANSKLKDLGKVIKRRMHLINTGRVFHTPGSDWIELEAKLNDLVNQLSRTNILRDVYLNYEALETLLRSHEANNAMADFDLAISPAMRQRIVDNRNRLSTRMRALYNSRTKKAKFALFEDLDELVKERTGSVKSGWIKLSDARAELLELSQRESGRETRDLIGIRDWYVLEEILPNVKNIILEYQDLANIVSPKEFEKAIIRNIRKAESTNLSSADLNNYYQRILGIIADFPADTVEKIGVRNHLSAEIQSSLLMNQLFSTIENSEGNPEQLIPIFQQIKNLHAEKGINTLEYFMRRFRMRYSDGEALENDGKLPILDARGEAYDFNLLSDFLNIYYNQLSEERIMFNEIEDAQRERRGIRGINRAIFRDRGVQVPTGLDKTSLEQWFKRNTLIGASNDPTPAGDTEGETYVEKWNTRMLNQFRTHLRNNRGLNDAQLQEMEVILRATNLNALRFTQAFGWAEFDQIDIFDKKGNATYALVSERSPFYGRHIDNLFKFYRNEGRGRVSETNKILEESMPLGYMLPTCRVLVRFTDVMLLREESSPEIFDLAAFNARTGLSLSSADGRPVTIKQAVDAYKEKLMKQYDTSDRHAEGVAVADMIDHGDIRYGRMDSVDSMLDWEEEVRDLTRFNFVDIHSDRNAALKMYDRGVLQEYLKRPSYENLMNVYGQRFYSGRNLRLWPNLKIAIKAHHKIEQQAKKWFNAKRRGTAYETDSIIEEAVVMGQIDPEDEEKLKRELLGIGPLPLVNRVPVLNIIPGIGRRIPGIGPVRATRFWAEFFDDAVVRRYVRNIPASLASAFFEFIAGLFKQSAQQIGAGAR